MITYFPRVVRWLVAAILVLAPLAYWPGVFFPHTFTKTILFYILVELACVFWIPLAISSPQYRPRLSCLTAGVGILFAAFILASATGLNWGHSLWSDLERMTGLFTILHLIVFFLITSSFARDNVYRSLLLQLSFGAAVLVAIIGLFQLDTAAVRLESTVGNAAFLATYLLMHVFVGLMLLLEEKVWNRRAYVYMVGVMLVIVALIFTETRAGVLGFLAGIVALGLLFLFFSDSNEKTLGIMHTLLKRLVFGVFIGGILALALMFAFQERLIPYAPSALDRYLSVGIQERTVEGRFLIWQVAWKGIQERPLFGWGMDNQHILVDRHYDARLYALEPWIDRAHNIVFDMGAMAGVMGMLAYAAVIILAFWVLYKKFRAGVFPFRVAASLAALLAAYIAQNFFTFDTPLSYIFFFFILGIIDGMEEKGKYSYTVSQWSASSTVAMIVTLLLVVPTGYVGAWKPWRASTAAFAGWTALAKGEGDAEAIASFEKALWYNTYGNIDFRRMFAEYIFEFLKQGGQRPDESLRRLMDYAVAGIDANMKEAPENVKWWMYQGELYNLMAVKFDPSFAHKAEEMYMRARTLSAERPQIYLELAQARKMQGDIIGMWEALDTLQSIVPDEYEALHMNVATLAIEVKDVQREQREVAWLLQHGRGDPELRDAFFRVKRYSDAVTFQLRFIAKEERRTGPEALTQAQHFTLYAHLAALYQYAGEKEKARESALKAGSLDPTRQAEVEAFLKSIGY